MSQTIPTAPETKLGVSPKNPPGPHSLSPLGSAHAVGHDLMRFALGMWHKYSDVVRYRVLSWSAYALYHPVHVKQVLQEKHRNYDKQSSMMKVISSNSLIGNGLFTNDGGSRLHQRRLMQPSFHHQPLADFGRLMSEATVAMLEGGGAQPQATLPWTSRSI